MQKANIGQDGSGFYKETLSIIEHKAISAEVNEFQLEQKQGY